MSLLAGALLALGQPAAADELTSPTAMPGAGDVDIRASLGFSDTVRLGHHAPLTVTLANRGPALVGRLEVVAADGDPVLGGRFTTTHVRAVELPREARKRFRFTLFFESFAQPLRVRVLDGARVLAEHDVDLRQRVTTARLLLVLGRDADLDTLNDPRVGSLRVLYPLPDLLPGRWQGYDGVVAVVLHGASLERLGSGQFEALRKWLARGGVLLVSGGPDYTLLGTPRLAALLPGVPVGQVRVAEAEVTDAALATLPVTGGAFDVNQVRDFTGRVLLGSAERPLAIERPSGRGRVVYLTFDVTREPFLHWTGMRDLWLDLLRLPPVESLAARLEERPRDPPLERFVARAAAAFPARLPVLLFLLLYLGVLVVGLGRRGTGAGRGWPAPALAWLTPLAFALGAQLVFGHLLFPKHTSVFVAGVVRPHGHGSEADLELQLGWYANHHADAGLEYAGVDPKFRPLRAGGVRAPPPGDWQLGDPPQGTLRPESSRGYRLHAVSGEDVIAFDLQARVTLTPRGPVLELGNHTGRTIHDAWLVARGVAYPLGDIAPGATWSRLLEPAAGAGRFGEERWFNVLRRAADDARDEAVAERRRLAVTLLAARDEPNPPADRVLLAGVVPSPLRLVGASAPWARRELTLLLASLPLNDSGQGRRAR